MSPSAPRLCWVVTDGRRGIENQALGLAEAVGRLTPLTIERRIAPRAESLKDRASAYMRAPRIEDLTAPRDETAGRALPDLWIGCGRASLPYSERARAWLGGRGFVVQVQDPRRPLQPFDLVIPPLHDRLEGPNVFSILGSPNRVSAERLAAGAEVFKTSAAAPPRPCAAVLIGGDSKRHRLTAATLEVIEDAMRGVQAEGWGLLVTVSRRTPPAAAAALSAAWRGRPGVWFWASEMDGPNPYDAFLAGADVVLATEDSTNMITEAATAGKPVLLLPMDGDDGKFVALYEALARRGNARAYDGRIQSWPVEPLRETERAAAEIVRRLNSRHSNSRPTAAPGPVESQESIAMAAHRFTSVGAHALVARDGDVYIAAQPRESDLDAWAARGVKTVVNLRSRVENESLPYRAQDAMAARGFAYTEIPMGGADGVSPEIRERLTKALSAAKGPVVLHCAGGPRAAYAYAAHLIAEGQASPDEVADIGWPGGLSPDVLGALLPR